MKKHGKVAKKAEISKSRKRDASVESNGRANKLDVFLRKLQAMQEIPLTQFVVLPVFAALGYQTDAHGGPYEGGKDIICWGIDELDEVKLVTVQVKRYQPSARARDKASFSEIVTQISQTLEQPVPHLNGQTYLPFTTYFVTPYLVSTRALATRFERYRELRGRNVRIIDGKKLFELVEKHLPYLVSELIGPEYEVADATHAALTNEVLLTALGYDQKKDLSAFYTDIDFSLGRISTRLLFNSEFKPKSTTLQISENDWIRLKGLWHVATNQLGVEIFQESPDAVEEAFANDAKKYRNYLEAMSENKRIAHSVEEEIRSLDNAIDAKNTLLLAKLKTSKSSPEIGRCTPAISQLRKAVKSIFAIGRSNSDDIASKSRECIAKIHRVIRDETVDLTKLDDFLGKEPNSGLLVDFPVKAISLAEKGGETAFAIASLESDASQEPTYLLTMDSRKLSRKLIEEREQIKAYVQKINTSKPSTSDLTVFLLRCTTLFDACQSLLGNSYIAESLGIVGEQRFHLSRDSYRLSTSIDLILNTGLNVAVLGEAGAGKTTSLQMYAYKRLVNSPRSSDWKFHSTRPSPFAFLANHLNA